MASKKLHVNKFFEKIRKITPSNLQVINLKKIDNMSFKYFFEKTKNFEKKYFSLEIRRHL